MRPHRASYRDPGSGVFTDEEGDRVFRPLLYGPEVYNSLSVFPPILRNSHGNLYEVERIPFINYYHEWTFSEFQDSALFYLDLLDSLLKKGWKLRDAHPSNVTYDGMGRFIFMDHGSLVKDDGTGWQAQLQFIKSYAYPLLLLSNRNFAVANSLAPFIQDDSWQHRFRPPLFKRLSFGYQVLRAALLLSNRKSNGGHGRARPGFGLTPRHSIAFLRDFVGSVKPRLPASKWGDYYDRTILGDGYLERKSEILSKLLSKVADRVTTAADFGASSGKITGRLADRFKGIRFIAIESDPNASEELYLTSKNGNILPIHGNILQLTPALGFDGSYPSLDERLRSTSGLNLALGIIHHMMHGDTLPFERIIRFFKERSVPGAFLMIEHVGPEDPRYRLIRNPEYPYPEDRPSFENALAMHYRIIDQEEAREGRTIYLAEAV